MPRIAQKEYDGFGLPPWEEQKMLDAKCQEERKSVACKKESAKSWRNLWGLF